jgi:hypothetical protein
MLFLGHKNGIMMVETTVEATTTIVEVGITMVEVGTTMVEDITMEEEEEVVVVVEEVCGKILPISSYYDRH